LILALDFPDATTAQQKIAVLEPGSCRLKVGMELFTAAGPALVEALMTAGFEVFLDLKFHDIPTTVARACRAAARLGVWMLNIHAAGGSEMLQAAREAIAGESHQPLLIGVTVLTSLSAADLAGTGIDDTPAGQVQRLAGLCHAAGLDGIVCSAQEAASIMTMLGSGFALVTPGIRPAGCDSHDQKRSMSPTAAIRAGSHYLVMGRPVFQDHDPAAMVRQLNGEITAAWSGR